MHTLVSFWIPHSWPGVYEECTLHNALCWRDFMSAGMTNAEREHAPASPRCNVPVGSYRTLLGLLLVWQASITWRLQSQALPEPSSASMRFRYPGLPLAPLLILPSQQAAVSALSQAMFGLVLASGKWTASASCASLAVLVHLLLLDQCLYQNHYWLLCNVLLCFAVAAHRPRTLLALLRFTHGLPYAFGALSKLSVDWLLRQQPATHWCSRVRGVSWLPDPLLAWCPAAMSVGGLTIDALIVPLLLLPSRYRMCANLLAAAFHISNALLFHIGIFPFLMLASHLLWMDRTPGPGLTVQPPRPLTEQHIEAPSNPSRCGDQTTQGVRRHGHRGPRHRVRAADVPVEAAADNGYDGALKHNRRQPLPSRSLPDVGVATFCACFMLFHLTWPLRRWVLYDGASLWSQEGYFGAWQMKQVIPTPRILKPHRQHETHSPYATRPPCPTDTIGRFRRPRLPAARPFQRGRRNVAGCYFRHAAGGSARRCAGATDRPHPHAASADVYVSPSHAAAVCSTKRSHTFQHC